MLVCGPEELLHRLGEAGAALCLAVSDFHEITDEYEAVFILKSHPDAKEVERAANEAGFLLACAMINWGERITKRTPPKELFRELRLAASGELASDAVAILGAQIFKLAVTVAFPPPP